MVFLGVWDIFGLTNLNNIRSSLAPNFQIRFAAPDLACDSTKSGFYF